MGVCVIDRHDIIQYVNLPLSKLLHLRAERMIGHRIQQVIPLIPPSLLETSAGANDRPNDQPNSEEWRHDDRHGSAIWLRATAERFDQADGLSDESDPLRLLTFEDITQTRQTQMHLSEAQTLFRFAIQNTSVVLFTIDVEGRIQHFEGRGMSELVQDPDAIIGQPLQDVYRLPELSGELAFVMGGHSFTSYHRLNNRDFITYYNPVTDLDDRVIRVLGLTVDITDQTAAYQLAREAEIQYEMIFERVSDIVFITDQNGRFAALNPAFKAVTGYDSAEWIGKPLFDLVSAEDRHRLVEAWQHMETGGPLRTVEVRMSTQAGREINVEIRARMVMPRDTRYPDSSDPEAQMPPSCVGVARDITQRKLEVLQELQVELEYERLEMLNRFIHNVSHDIRTPLSVINSAVYLIRRKVDEVSLEKVEPHLAMVDTQVQHLNNQFNNLLTIPDIHLRRRNLVFSHYDLTALLRGLIDEQYPAIQRRRQQIRYLPPNSAVMMYGMEEEIRRALRHVLTNAITYTPSHGHILLMIAVSQQGVKITVRDNGIGISPDHISHIFEPFYRVDQARQLDTGGMGLGLTVAKTIIEAHQGRISAESEPNHGTTFTIDLPFLKQEDY